MAQSLFISNHGLILRAKLINKFKLLDHNMSWGADKKSFVTSAQIKSDDWTEKSDEKDDNVLVNSDLGRTVFRPDKTVKEIFDKPRHVRNMVKPSKLQKISLFAHKLNNNKWYQNFLLVVLVIFSLLMGLNVECAFRRENSTYSWLYWTTLSLIYLCLPLFFFDPALGYIEDAVRFTKNGWYLLDCVLNVTGITSGVGLFFNLSPTWLFWNLHVFQVLRCLKIIRLVPVVNLLVKAIHQAVKDMIFVLLTFLLVIFVFALAAMMMFAHYEESSHPNLQYSNSFNGLGNAIQTLFNIYTFDTWPKRFLEIRKVFGTAGAAWVILWVCLGGFIIKSIFDGVFIYKFQESHQAVLQETELELDREGDEKRMNEFLNRLQQESEFLRSLRPPTDSSSDREYRKVVGEMLNLCASHELTWSKYVKTHLEALDRWHYEAVWPKDTLFNYLQAMESLMENLKERQIILQLLNETLLSFHDVNPHSLKNFDAKTPILEKSRKIN